LVKLLASKVIVITEKKIEIVNKCRLHPKAFTLIELLVVIAIIAVLLSILTPSLKLAKKKAASIVCMTNAKNLSTGWCAYNHENDGYLMSARMGGRSGPNGSWIPAWVETPYNTTPGDRGCRSVSPIVTDEDEFNGIRDGALYPYLEDPGAYTCPADSVKSLYDGTEKFVTFTIPSGLAGTHTSKVFKESDIPSPSTRYNFVESAEERNWNMGAQWAFGFPGYTGADYYIWWGPMAVNHGETSVLGFCDGHAEVHSWRDPWTKERIVKLSTMGADLYNLDWDSGHTSENDVDIAYMARGWPDREK